MREKLASLRRSFSSKPRSSQVLLEQGTFEPSQGHRDTKSGVRSPAACFDPHADPGKRGEGCLRGP
jgi:hypothetical protein